MSNEEQENPFDCYDPELIFERLSSFEAFRDVVCNHIDASRGVALNDQGMMMLEVIFEDAAMHMEETGEACGLETSLLDNMVTYYHEGSTVSVLGLN